MQRNGFGILFFLLVTFMTSPLGAAPKEKPYGDGMPLPWPFPWAQHCPVDWEEQQGRYSLMDSRGGEEIEFIVTEPDLSGTLMVHMSRYSRDGVLMDDGFTYMGRGQKMIRLWLKPADQHHLETLAILRLYHRSTDLLCQPDHLVPILTLQWGDGDTHTQSQYRLERTKIPKD